MKNWYRVHAKCELYNTDGSYRQMSTDRIIAKFYIPSDAEQFVRVTKVNHPNWITYITEGR